MVLGVTLGRERVTPRGPSVSPIPTTGELGLQPAWVRSILRASIKNGTRGGERFWELANHPRIVRRGDGIGEGCRTLQWLAGEGIAGNEVGTLRGRKSGAGQQRPHRLSPIQPTKQSALHTCHLPWRHVPSFDQDTLWGPASLRVRP